MVRNTDSFFMILPLPTEETIAAIATAVSAGQGGIAIIRISGPSAQKVGKKIIQLPTSQIWGSHKVLYGHVIDPANQNRIDEVLILIMESPKSFTGEDVVEIHCHGGLINVQRILEKVLEQPEVRRAFPGEFSQRAVLNGRLDLTQAEAINDLISARSRKAAQLAMAGVDGDINQKMKSLREKLLDQLSEIEARVDFEDELPKLDEKALVQELFLIKNELDKLISDAKKASFIRNGLKVALIGLPNVGKSSLLNLLSKRNKAIVTEFPGTTRDLLESEIILEGIPLTLIDTAGIRSTNNEVEKIGIALSQEALNTADVVVLIFDISIGWTEEVLGLSQQIPKNIPMLLVGNKSDIRINTKDIKPDVIMSALTGAGEEALINALLRTCGASEFAGLEIALNERQLDLASLSVAALNKTLELANQDMPWDFWTIDLRESIHKLGELTGDEISEALLDKIFTRFCIGK